jgi:hypothetical protein
MRANPQGPGIIVAITRTVGLVVATRRGPALADVFVSLLALDIADIASEHA